MKTGPQPCFLFMLVLMYTVMGQLTDRCGRNNCQALLKAYCGPGFLGGPLRSVLRSEDRTRHCIWPWTGGRVPERRPGRQGGGSRDYTRFHGLNSW